MSTNGVARNGSVDLHWNLQISQQSDRDPESILLVNGLGSPMVAYEQGFIDELTARGFSVVRFDNRDVGKSSATDEPYGLLDMANDVLAVMDTIGWETAHIFGMSMGGMIAQQVAIDHPARVRSMISMMSSTGESEYGKPTAEALTSLMTPAPEDRAGWIDHRLTTEKAWSSPNVDTTDPGWNAAKADLMFDYGVSPEGVRKQYQAIMRSGNRREGLRSVALPVMVMHGSHDTLIQPDGGRRTAELIPGSQLQILEGMGHDMPPSFFIRIADALATFVGALP